MKIGELFMALGFDVDDAKLDSFEGKIDKLKTNMVITAAKTTATLWAIDRFVAGTIQAATALTNLNTQTDLSTQKTQKWVAVSQMKNLAADASSVMGSIRAIQDNLTQIRLGGGNVTPFQMLGIDVRGKDAFDVLEQIRERIKGLDRNVAVNLLSQLGIDPTMLDTLQLTRQEFAALGDEFIRSKESTDRIMSLGFAIQTLKMRLSFWKDDFVSYIAPFLEKGIDLFYRLKDSVLNIKQAMDQNPEVWEKVKIGLALVASALALLWIKANPIKALIFGIYLAIDDLATYLNGGQSFFGDFVSQLEMVAKYLADAKNTIEWFLLHGGYALGLVSSQELFDRNNPRQSFNQFTPDQLAVALARVPAGKALGNSITMNNTVNVEVSGNASYDDFTQRLQREMNSLWDKSLSSTIADFNNGGR